MRVVTSIPKKIAMQEYDSVRLKKSLPDADIPVGSRGIIVMIYESHPPAYEVEFFDASGNTLRDSRTSAPTFTTDDEHLEKQA